MKGVLIYAFNNETIDYFQQAVWCADRVRRHLGLPVTIITDPTSRGSRDCQHDIVLSDPESGGSRLLHPSGESVPSRWYNAKRYLSYALSPYEQTLVLDSDYIVASDQLLRLFDSNIAVMAIKHVFDLTGRQGFKDFSSISDRGTLHHWWATVLYFRRSQIAQDMFDVMDMVKNNYLHYANIYRFRATPFRNDFAVSIALHMVYGQIPQAIPAVPWPMANVYSDVDITQTDLDAFELRYLNSGDAKRVTVKDQDFHFMNKHALGRLCEHIA